MQEAVPGIVGKKYLWHREGAWKVLLCPCAKHFFDLVLEVALAAVTTFKKESIPFAHCAYICEVGSCDPTVPTLSPVHP